MQNEIIDIQFLRSLAPFTNRDSAISKLQSLTWSVGKPAVATYKVGSETRGLLAIGIADGVGKCRILADDEDFQTLKVYTEALNKKVDDYIEVTDAWKEVVDSWRSVTDDRLVELEGKSHVQNTDTGTTSPTFQVDSTSNGPKLKGKGGDLELRNAGDTDYAGLTLGDITIKGNVTQEGDTFISQAETVEINDNLLLVNKGEVGAGVTKGIAGIEIDRGTLPNYQIVFDESDKRFKAGEIGNIWPLALRDEEVNMVDGMFVTWDSTTKRLKTTNIVPSNRKLFFTDNNSYLQLVSHDFSGSELVQTLAYTNARGSLFVSAGSSNLSLDTDKTSFRFYKNIIVPSSIEAGTDMVFKRNGTTKLTLKDTVAQFTVPVTATTFNRASDGSEVLYHADIVDDLVTGGTGKVLSAEQGKLLAARVTSVEGDYLSKSKGGIVQKLTVFNEGVQIGTTTDIGWYPYVLQEQALLMGSGDELFTEDEKKILLERQYDTRICAGIKGVRGVNVGDLLVSSDWIDFTKVPINGIYSKGTIRTGMGIQIANNQVVSALNSEGVAKRLIGKAPDNSTYVGSDDGGMILYTSSGVDLMHYKGGASYRIWDAYNFDPDSKANRINPVVEQTLTLNTSTTGYKVKLGVDGTGYPGMFVLTQGGVSKSSLHYSPKSDAWEILTGTQSGKIATQGWVIDQVPTIFYARGFEVRKLNAAVNLDSDLLYGGAAVNYSDLTYWTNAPEGFSYGTVYQLGLQDYTNLNAQLAFDIVHTSDTDQKTNHLWFRTSGKAGYGVAGWKRVVTADELEGYVPSGDLSNYYTKTQSDARYWTKTELVNPATKSGDNTFTGKNSFQGGKFNVTSFSIDTTSNPVVNLNAASGTAWARGLYLMANNDATSRFVFGGYNAVDNTSAGYAYISIGNVAYNNAQYKFKPNALTVPVAWSLDDSSGNALVWTQSATLVHLGRALGTTKIRSGAVDLIHTKGSTDYKILDESNWESIIPNAKWTYGFVSYEYGSETSIDLNTVLEGPNAPKAVYNYTAPSYWKNGPAGMSYGSVFKLYSSGINTESLYPQLAFDIIHDVDNGTGKMWFRTANNKGMAVANWKRVLTEDEGIVKFKFDSNTYPTLIQADGKEYLWLRASGSGGFIPNTQVTLSAGGIGSVGTTNWAFKSIVSDGFYGNKYFFGSTGTFLQGSADDVSLLNSGSAKRLNVGSLLVSSNYANVTLVPNNGIFSSGRIQTNADMMVGYSTNVTNGQLGYGINYAGTMAIGMGSEYSSGALVLYKFLNPNSGKAGYSVPRAATGTPCYLKLNAGNLTLGVGTNKAYTAGEAVTVTEYTVLHQGNGIYLGVNTTYVPVRLPASKAEQATGNGYLEWWNSAGWVNHRAGKYIVNGGSSSQFLKGDGSLDSTVYYPNAGRGYLSFDSSGRPVISNNQGYSARDKDGNAREIMWISTENKLTLGNTSGSTTISDILFNYAGTSVSISSLAKKSECLPLTGGRLTGQLTIAQSADDKLILQSLDADNYSLIRVHDSSGNMLGRMGWAGTKWAVTHDSDLYELWDKYNLPTPASTTDLANYLPLIGGTLTGQVIFDSYGLAFNNITWTNDLVPNRTYGGYLQVLDAYNAGTAEAGGPTSYGTVLQLNSRPSHWANQLWFGNNQEVYFRHMDYNSTSYGSWKRLATDVDLVKYLPLTGGKLSGQLTISAGSTNPLKLNNTAYNASECFVQVQLNGTSKTAIGFLSGSGSYIYNYESNKFLFVKSDGAYYGTSSSNTKLATLSDIPDVSGFVKSTSTRKVKDIQIVDSLPTTQASGVLYLVVK